MKLLQNFFPKILFQGSSEFSKNIKIVQVGKTRKLIVDGIVQSTNLSTKHVSSRIWQELSQEVVKRAPNTKNVLLLGMGAGTMIRLLQEKLPEKNVNFTSVEIDKKIVELAKEYFELDQIPHNNVIVADAQEVVKNPHKFNIHSAFDCVIVDTYIGMAFSQNNNLENFIDDISTLSRKETLLIFNKIVKKEHEQELQKFVQKISNKISNVQVKKVEVPAFADNYIVSGFIS